MAKLSRSDALQELRQFSDEFAHGRRYSDMSDEVQCAMGQSLNDIADAMAKPALGLDWQPGSTLKDLPERLHRTEILVRVNPDSDYRMWCWQNLGMTQAGCCIMNGVATSAEIEDAFGRYHGWAEIPNGIAKPEARLDWTPVEELPEGDPDETFAIFRPATKKTKTLPRLIIEYLNRTAEPDGHWKGAQYAEIPLPKGEPKA